MTFVTATRRRPRYLSFIKTREFAVTKLYCIILSAVLLAPFAFATLNQATQIVA